MIYNKFCQIKLITPKSYLDNMRIELILSGS